MSDSSTIQSIRKFNRYYTNVLGLIDHRLLNSVFSLEDVRILYEIGHSESCTAKYLTEYLRLDAGYLSRILKGLEKADLINRTQSKSDARMYYIHLTEPGRVVLADLEQKANQQIQELTAHLSPDRKEKIVSSMQTIESLLSPSHKDIQKDIKIRCELRAGDAGYLAYLQSKLYHEEYGYGFAFEAYVCKTFYECLPQYDPAKDRFWIAEHNGEIIGAIAILGRTEERAQLRWLVLHPSYRGMGIGKTLIQHALDYCKEKGYQIVYLETTDVHKAAIALYKKAGFVKIAEQKSTAFGTELTEETYELCL